MPIRGECNIENIVYQVNISRKEDKLNSKAYIGISSLNWKLRHYKPLLKNQIPLSKYSWKKDQVLTPIINLKILKKIINNKQFTR